MPTDLGITLVLTTCILALSKEREPCNRCLNESTEQWCVHACQSIHARHLTKSACELVNGPNSYRQYRRHALVSPQIPKHIIVEAK